jgi:hypothetical protein
VRRIHGQQRCRRRTCRTGARGARLEPEIDPDYIRTAPQRKGMSFIAAVASKLVHRVARHGYAHPRAGANALLQVHCAVLDGIDVRHFKRWYPRDQRVDDVSQPKVAQEAFPTSGRSACCPTTTARQPVRSLTLFRRSPRSPSS